MSARLKRPLEGDCTPEAKRGRPKVSQELTRYPRLSLGDTANDDMADERNMQQLARELQRELQSIPYLSYKNRYACG